MAVMGIEDLRELKRKYEEARRAAEQRRVGEAQRARDEADKRAARLREAKEHIPAAKAGILEVVKEVNREVFGGRGKVTGWLREKRRWEKRYEGSYFDSGGTDHLAIDGEYLGLTTNDGFSYVCRVVYGYRCEEVHFSGFPNNNMMEVWTGIKKVSLLAQPGEIVDQAREDLIMAIENAIERKRQE